MKAESVKAIWAWWMFHGDPRKDIENRSRRTNYRGRLYIHTSARLTRSEYMEACAFVARRGLRSPLAPLACRVSENVLACFLDRSRAGAAEDAPPTIAAKDVLDLWTRLPAPRLPDPVVLPLGVIIGYVDLVDCVDHSDSPWFTGLYGQVLTNPVLLPNPVPCRGRLGIWDVPDEVAREIEGQLSDDH